MPFISFDSIIYIYKRANMRQLKSVCDFIRRTRHSLFCSENSICLWMKWHKVSAFFTHRTLAMWQKSLLHTLYSLWHAFDTQPRNILLLTSFYFGRKEKKRQFYMCVSISFPFSYHSNRFLFAKRAKMKFKYVWRRIRTNCERSKAKE